MTVHSLCMSAREWQGEFQVMATEVTHSLSDGGRALDRKQRARRFHFFQIVFVLTYIGIVLDIVTTAMGVRLSGAKYEQNPLGSVLIGGLGWLGLLAFMTIISLVAYVSCKVVQWHGSPGWARFVNGAFVVLAAVRWLAVVTAIAYLVQSR